MRNLKRYIFILLMSYVVLATSGCVLLFIPAALIGNSVHQSNEEKDRIMANFAYQYRQYYHQLEEKNKGRKSQGLEEEGILSYSEWLKTLTTNKKEKRAIERYEKLRAGEK